MKLRKTSKVAFSGIVAALSLVVMLASFIPSAEFVCAAIAGILIAVIAIEADFRWAAVTYAVVSILSFFIGCPKEAVLLFVIFFGYYAFLKLKLDKLRPKMLGRAVKCAVFLASIGATYLAFTVLLDYTADDFGSFGRWTLIISGVGSFAAMVIYDVALKGIYAFYFQKVRGQIMKVMR